jgi:DNA-binding SARP family transcriptional activator/Tfp pilus assembly protein PilF
MYRLKTFGGVVIEGPDGPLTGAVSQRRRLAVLVLLAAGGNGISRDRLVSLLWPETGEERARHALAQLLYAVRRELGADALTGSATALRLDPDTVSSDVQDFHAALERGDDDRAAALYTGPFLDGFHLAGCAEFERWLDEQRARLSQLVRAALERLARHAEAAGDRAGAIRRWHGLVALDPYDPRATIALMNALAAAGDRPGAVRQAKVHEALVRDQLGVEPDPEVVELAATLALLPRAAASGSSQPADSPSGLEVARAAEEIRPDARPSGPPAPSGGPTDAASEAPGAGDLPAAMEPAAGVHAEEAAAMRSAPLAADAVAAAVASPGLRLEAGAPPRRRPPPQRRLALVASLAAIVVSVAAFLSVRSGVIGGGPASEDPSAWVIVAATENGTDDPIFDRTVPYALAAGLGQGGGFYVVPPDRIGEALARMRRAAAAAPLDESTAREVARREGVRFVIVPGVRTVDDGYELTARVIDAANGAVTAVATAHARDQLAVMDVLDRLSRKVRRALGESALRVAMRSTPLPRVTTTSLPALEKFASGGRAFAMGLWAEAETLWREAVALDSTFATAHSALGTAAYWANRATEGEAHFARALAAAQDLPDRERTLLRAQVESWRGNREASVHLVNAYLVEHPTDIEALRHVAYDYLRLERHAEAAAIYRRLLRLDSTSASLLINLATVEKGLGALDSALAHYRQAFRVAPQLETENSNLNHEYGSTYVRLGMLDSARAVFARMLPGSRSVRARGLRSLAFLAMDRGRYGEAADMLQQAIPLNQAERAGTSELRNRLLLATALGQTGATEAARAQLDAAYAVATGFDADPILLYWLGKALCRNGDATRAAALLAQLDANRHPANVPARAASAALQGEILAAQGDARAALPHLEQALREDSSKITLESLAHAVAAAGDHERAERLYEDLARDPLFGHEGQEPYRMALFWHGIEADERGDVELAARALERFLSSWRDADASWPALVEARDRIARLRGPGG